jgi:hypothetical protein
VNETRKHAGCPPGPGFFSRQARTTASMNFRSVGIIVEETFSQVALGRVVVGIAIVLLGIDAVLSHTDSVDRVPGTGNATTEILGVKMHRQAAGPGGFAEALETSTAPLGFRGQATQPPKS